MLPSALAHVPEIVGAGDELAVFLDYDGTLTPVVSTPDHAGLIASTRAILCTLAAKMANAISNGTHLKDVRKRLDIDGIVYAGSHGFDIAGPRGLRKEMATEFLPRLDMVEKKLGDQLTGIPGARLERKRFSIAAHYRNVNESDVPKVERAVSEVAARHCELRKMDGKKVYELLPDLDWDKGKAVPWLLEGLGLQLAKIRPIYIGDDRTDEDAFRALEKSGVAILVSEQPRPTAARYSPKEPTEVERFLPQLVASPS